MGTGVGVGDSVHSVHSVHGGDADVGDVELGTAASGEEAEIAPIMANS